MKFATLSSGSSFRIQSIYISHVLVHQNYIKRGGLRNDGYGKSHPAISFLNVTLYEHVMQRRSSWCQAQQVGIILQWEYCRVTLLQHNLLTTWVVPGMAPSSG